MKSRPVLKFHLLAAAFLMLQTAVLVADERPYFPTTSAWETVTPQQAGVDEKLLDIALEFAMSRKSSSVIVLHKGRILAERHAAVANPSRRYVGMVHGKNEAGHVVEDVASVQKSVTSVLVGIALQKHLLTLDDSVTQHLGAGWSRATPDQEQAITLRHLITMTSGLSEQLKYVAAPGSRWQYNTTAYSQSLKVVAKVAGLPENEVTQQWLTGPLQMTDSEWVKRGRFDGRAVVANGFGFATSARDLARFGLMVLNNGRWHEQQVVTNDDYLKAMASPSQELNPSYGYLWWLNGQEFVLRGTRKIRSPLVASAPKDMFAAQGALGRKCYVVPSADLVVVRLGDDPDSVGDEKFDQRFWQLLRKAAAK